MCLRNISFRSRYQPLILDARERSYSAVMFFMVHHFFAVWPKAAPMSPCQKLGGPQKLKEHEGFDDTNMRVHVLEDDEYARNVKKKRCLQFEMIAFLPPYLAHYTGPKPLGDNARVKLFNKQDCSKKCSRPNTTDPCVTFLCANLGAIFISKKSLTLFLPSNFHSKAKNPADDMGQMVTYSSCDTLSTAPPSHVRAVETLFFRLV